MQKTRVVASIEKKLKSDKASLFTETEIAVLVAEVRRLLGPGFADLIERSPVRTEDVIRWSSLSARCQQARTARGVSLKDVSVALRLPKYRLAAVEEGRLSEIKPEVAHRYFQFLDVGGWVSRWCRKNPELARRAGIMATVRPKGRRGPEVRHATSQAAAGDGRRWPGERPRLSGRS